LARSIAAHAGRRPDYERLLFAIVDGCLEDHKLTAPTFILRRLQRVLSAPEVVRSALAPALFDSSPP